MRPAPLLVALALAGAARAEPPLYRVEAERGWFEEALALDDAGGRLALVRSDGAGGFELEVRDLEQRGAVLSRVRLAAAPAEVGFTRAGPLAIFRGDGGARAELFTAGRTQVYQGTEIARAERDGKELIVVYERRGRTHAVAIHDPGAPRPPVRRTLVEDGQGTIAALRLEPRAWRDGFTRLGGRRPGRFDAASDRRLPDTWAVFDLVEARVERDGVPADLVAHARVQRERERRPGAGAFLFVDGGQLLAVAADDRLAAVELPLASYEPASLRQQARGDAIVFSLRVDPLNPAALARRRRDPERIDFFRWTPGAAAPEPLRRLPGDGRDVVWHAAGGRVAVLHKHRAFGRGGPEVTVHTLAARR